MIRREERTLWIESLPCAQDNDNFKINKTTLKGELSGETTDAEDEKSLESLSHILQAEKHWKEGKLLVSELRPVRFGVESKDSETDRIGREICLGRHTPESIAQQQERIVQLREEARGFRQKEEAIFARFRERREMREVSRKVRRATEYQREKNFDRDCECGCERGMEQDNQADNDRGD